MLRTLFALLAFSLGTLTLSFPPGAQAQDNCSTLLMVSGYRSNNVKIYDGCTYEYLRDLDDGNRIRGAQAVRMGPDGLLYVVSEINNRILRYDAQTLEFVDIFIRDDPNTPTMSCAACALPPQWTSDRTAMCMWAAMPPTLLFVSTGRPAPSRPSLCPPMAAA